MMEKKEKVMPEFAQFLRALLLKWTWLRWLAVKQKQTNHMKAQNALIMQSNKARANLIWRQADKNNTNINTTQEQH